MPKKIDRKTANQLSGLTPHGQKKDATKIDNNGNEMLTKNYEQDIVDEKDSDKENIDTTKITLRPYVPGDYTEQKHQPPSHEDLVAHLNGNNISEPRGFPNIREDFSKPIPEAEKDLSKEAKEFCELNKEMVNLKSFYKDFKDSRKEKRLLSPILAAISNFSLAKRLHRENLEHNPLPDCVTDSMFKKLQMQRERIEPGLTLEDKHFASAVGWNGHPGYGPTKCTKRKVYRPKTCGVLRDKDNDSVCSFDRKWRFIRQSKVTPMDLAICWDLTPENPKDEPLRTTHIDGSNGSAAPAVFSIVHTPKSDGEAEAVPACDGIHGCGQVFANVKKGNEEKEYFFHRIKDRHASMSSQDSSKKPVENIRKEEDRRSTGSKSSSKSEESMMKKRAKSAMQLNVVEKQSIRSRTSDSSKNSRAKSAHNINDLDKRSSCSKELNNNDKLMKDFYQSAPNLCEHEKCFEKQFSKHISKVPNKKLCVACELKNMSLKETRPKSDYKMAFKAGIPQKPVSKSSYTLKVPKPKIPYDIKNYTIGSLAPPFSLQKTKRYDYPEHWRLATVYQHSYKPIHARKRPLLHTVYK